MNKKNKIIFSIVFVIVGCAGLFFFVKNKANVVGVSSETKKQTPIEPSRAVASIPDQIKTKAVAIKSDTVAVKPDHQKRSSYLQNKILSQKLGQLLYEDSLKKLGSSQQAKLVAEFITESLFREDNSQFSNYMYDLIAELNENTDKIYELLISKEDVLQKDRFKHLMSMNMLMLMNMSPTQKARIFGGALVVPYAFNSQGGVHSSSLNITNAMILMKESGLSKDEVYPYFEKAYMANRQNPKALKEFRARVESFYPEMADQF